MVDDHFSPAGGDNRNEHQVPLAEGHHKPIATNGSGVVHEVDIEMPAAGTRWALVDDWYDPDGRRGEFTVLVPRRAG